VTGVRADGIVEDYLERLNAELADLPPSRRAEIVQEITQHVTDARSELGDESDAAIRNLLERIGDPEEIAAEAIEATHEPTANARRRHQVVVTAAVVLIAVGVLAGVLIAKGNSGSKTVPPSRHAANTALLAHLPAPTALIRLASGLAGGRPWTFYAKVTRPGGSEINRPGVFMLPGLCTAILFKRHGSGALGGGGPCGDPRKMPKFAFAVQGPGTGLNARMLVGVTSFPAASIQIEFVRPQPSLVHETVTSAALPGLWFFVVDLPLQPIRSIEALGPSGKRLFQQHWPG